VCSHQGDADININLPRITEMQTTRTGLDHTKRASSAMIVFRPMITIPIAMMITLMMLMGKGSEAEDRPETHSIPDAGLRQKVQISAFLVRFEALMQYSAEQYNQH